MDEDLIQAVIEACSESRTENGPTLIEIFEYLSGLNINPFENEKVIEAILYRAKRRGIIEFVEVAEMQEVFSVRSNVLEKELVEKLSIYKNGDPEEVKNLPLNICQGIKCSKNPTKALLLEIYSYLNSVKINPFPYSHYIRTIILVGGAHSNRCLNIKDDVTKITHYKILRSVTQDDFKDLKLGSTNMPNVTTPDRNISEETTAVSTSDRNISEETTAVSTSEGNVSEETSAVSTPVGNVSEENSNIALFRLAQQNKYLTLQIQRMEEEKKILSMRKEEIIKPPPIQEISIDEEKDAVPNPRAALEHFTAKRLILKKNPQLTSTVINIGPNQQVQGKNNKSTQSISTTKEQLKPLKLILKTPQIVKVQLNNKGNKSIYEKKKQRNIENDEEKKNRLKIQEIDLTENIIHEESIETIDTIVSEIDKNLKKLELEILEEQEKKAREESENRRRTKEM